MPPGVATNATQAAASNGICIHAVTTKVSAKHVRDDHLVFALIVQDVDHGPVHTVANLAP